MRRLSFAVITDAHYTGSAEQLSRAVEAINAERPDFTIQLGDLVDVDASNLPRILPVIRSLTMPQYHVLGNHDFCVPRAELQQQLGLASGWYEFAAGGWRFVVLDGMDLSLPGEAAAEMLAALAARNAPYAQEWNGGIGDVQKRWLREVLQGAGEPAIVFCHFPLVAEAATPKHRLWNCDEILGILQESPVVTAYLAGHAHDGGYALLEGIHHMTFPAMGDSGERNSYTFVDVYDDRLELRGSGTAPSRTLNYQRLRP